MVVSWFMIRPALTDTSDSARGRLASGIGITHLLLIVMLYLMIFKPGLVARACVAGRAGRASQRRRRAALSPARSALRRRP